MQYSSGFGGSVEGRVLMTPVTSLLQSRFMLRYVLPVVGVLLAFEVPAAAYLDPGSGSMLLQALLGGVAAVGVIARLYWHRVKTAISGKLQRSRR